MRAGTRTNLSAYTAKYKTLFLNKEGTSHIAYWLASSSICPEGTQVAHTMRIVLGGWGMECAISWANMYTAGSNIWDWGYEKSEDFEEGSIYPLRPVVELQSNVMTVKDTTTNEWKLI